MSELLKKDMAEIRAMMAARGHAPPGEEEKETKSPSKKKTKSPSKEAPEAPAESTIGLRILSWVIMIVVFIVLLCIVGAVFPIVGQSFGHAFGEAFGSFGEDVAGAIGPVLMCGFILGAPLIIAVVLIVLIKIASGTGSLFISLLTGEAEKKKEDK